MVLTAIIICAIMALVIFVIGATKRKEKEEQNSNSNSSITYTSFNNNSENGFIPVSQMEKDTEFEVYWNDTTAIAVVDFKNESGHSVVNIVDAEGEPLEAGIDDMSDEQWEAIRVQH